MLSDFCNLPNDCSQRKQCQTSEYEAVKTERALFLFLTNDVIGKCLLIYF